MKFTGTTIQRLVNYVEKSLLDLQVTPTQNFIESTAILIHEAMSGPYRRFHTTEHVFDVIDPKSDPILVLSALFHDIVYHNVDGGFTHSISEILKPYIRLNEGTVFITQKLESADVYFEMVLELFDLQMGIPLNPKNGINEFLSSLVFVKLFENLLTKKDILAVVSCLEASMPFRKNDQQGQSCFDILEERLKNGNKKWNLGLKDSQIIEKVKKAVKFANLDVNNFSCNETAVFLDNTWKLLPEQNPHLLENKVYTIKSYRSALERMEIFFNAVDVSVIFHHYRDEPSQEEFQRLQEQAYKNVNLAKSYLAGRLLATSILEALCMLTGGDAPVVMIMGNNSKGNVEPKYEFNDLIRQVPIQLAKDIDLQVLSLLEYEADVISILDFRKTPLAAYVYKCVGHKKTIEGVEMAKKFFSGEYSAQEFLACFDEKVITPIAEVCAAMISTRRDGFLNWNQQNLPRRKRG